MAKRLLAAAGLAALLAGVPLALLEFAGAPSPRSLPGLDGIRRAVELRWVPVEWAIQLVALLAWALWAYLVLAVLLRIAGHLEMRLRATGRLWAASEAWAWSPVKLAVDLVVGAALLSATLTQDSAGTGAARHDSEWAATIAPHLATLRLDPDPRAERPQANRSSGVNDQPRFEDPRRPSGNGTYVVRLGDSLWSIAEQKLDDPYKWTEIWRLNQGREMPDGNRLLRPGFIRPGWALRLPETERNNDRLHHHHDNQRQDGRRREADGQPPPDSVHASPTPTLEAESPATPESIDEEPSHRVELPSGTAVTLAFIAGFLSSLLLRRLQSRRWREVRTPSLGWPKAKTKSDLKARFIRSLAPDSEEVEGSTLDPFAQKRATDPTKIVLGHRNGAPVFADQRGVVYGFAGESEAVASYLRDLALHTLVSHASDAEIWTTRSLGLDALPGVKAFEDLRSLVSELEIEILKRHRLIDEEELENWELHQDAWPDDPLPLVVSIATEDVDALRNRLQAVAAQGQDLGLVVLAAETGGAAIQVDDRVLRPTGHWQEAMGEDFDPIRIAASDRGEIVRALTEESNQSAPEPPAQLQQAPDVAGDASVVRVKLLGPPEIVGDSEDVGDGFGAKSRELLFFLLLHPNGVSREQVIEALWPEAEPDKGTERLKFQLRVIRAHLRNDQAPTAKFIEKTRGLYRVVTEQFGVDVWAFERFIAQAMDTGDPDALEVAASLYRGELLQGMYYWWAEPIQSHLQDKFVDALVQLAAHRCQQKDFVNALEALRRAINVDRHGEYLYRKVMEIYGRLGRPNDVRRTFSELEAALEEIEVEPDQETVELRGRLLQQLQQKPTSANSA
jgi:DNA-binding SARP family transcriptional activator